MASSGGMRDYYMRGDQRSLYYLVSKTQPKRKCDGFLQKTKVMVKTSKANNDAEPNGYGCKYSWIAMFPASLFYVLHLLMCKDLISRTSLGWNQLSPTKRGHRNHQASLAHICYIPVHAIGMLFCGLQQLNTMTQTTPTDQNNHYVLDICEYHIGSMVWIEFICSSSVPRTSLE